MQGWQRDGGGAAVPLRAAAHVAADRSAHAAAVLPRDAGLDEHLLALRHAAASIAQADLSVLDAPAAAFVADGLRAIADQLGAVRARLLARVEADGRWAANGSARTFPDWVAGRGGSSVGAARREVMLGRALDRDVPDAGRAVARGDMSLEHAQVLSRYATTSDARRAALASDRADRNEAFLVAAAQRLGVDEYGRLVRRWAAAVDARSHEAEHAAAAEREYLRLTPRPGGVDLQGFLAAESAEVLRTALRAVGGVPAADDSRTPERRRAASLTSLARVVLDRGLGGAGKALVRPHLLVHVPFETFAALAADGVTGETGAAGAVGMLENADGSLGAPAELDDGTPVPLSSLARLACDAQLTRVVMDPAGQPLDVGRAQRTYTGPQRTAVVARDRTCRYPGCSAPPALCEVHHIRWWTRGGDTAVANGVLLCEYHHHLVHRRDIAIARGEDGQFVFERGGRLVAPPGAPPGGAVATVDAGRGRPGQLEPPLSAGQGPPGAGGRAAQGEGEQLALDECA